MTAEAKPLIKIAIFLAQPTSGNASANTGLLEQPADMPEAAHLIKWPRPTRAKASKEACEAERQPKMNENPSSPPAKEGGGPGARSFY